MSRNPRESRGLLGKRPRSRPRSLGAALAAAEASAAYAAEPCNRCGLRPATLELGSDDGLAEALCGGCALERARGLRCEVHDPDPDDDGFGRCVCPSGEAA